MSKVKNSVSLESQKEPGSARSRERWKKGGNDGRVQK